MNYKDALKEAKKKCRQLKTTDEAYLAEMSKIACSPHPGLSPGMVYNGARLKGLTCHSLRWVGT